MMSRSCRHHQRRSCSSLEAGRSRPGRAISPGLGVRVVAAGDALLAPPVTRRLIERFSEFRRRPASSPVLDPLTPREPKCSASIARGLSNAEISQQLMIAEQTTKTHIGRIFTKLNLRDRAQAVVTAYEAGLVTPGDHRREGGHGARPPS